MHSSDGFHSSATLGSTAMMDTQHSHYYHQHQQQQQQQQYAQNYTMHSSDSSYASSYGEHVTVLQIDQQQQQQQQLQRHRVASNVSETDFVTVVQIASTKQEQSEHHHYQSASNLWQHQQQQTGNSQRSIYVDAGQIEEEVTVYRLPGERLGMALRFDGGQTANETIRRVFVQSITSNSPASKAIGLMLGILREGDEILQIDGRFSHTLTRLECITMLRDAPVCIRLVVRRTKAVPANPENYFQPIQSSYSTTHIPTLVSSAETPMMSQLLSQSTDTLTVFGQNRQGVGVNNKVPPPVPPRMATTTLSIKRRPKSVCVIPSMAETESIVEIIHHSPSENGVVINNNQLPPVEKPPRRKHLMNGSLVSANGPPPLPPRRPKGPPPKPPTDRVSHQITITTTTAGASTAAKSNENESGTPIVTVISTKVVAPEPLNSIVSRTPQVSVVSISSPRTSPTHVNYTKSSSRSVVTNVDDESPKVTFTINNSKVSSFIRQTAERLQRKLSGKFEDEEEVERSNEKVDNDSKPQHTEFEQIFAQESFESSEANTSQSHNSISHINNRASITVTPTIDFESLTEDSVSCLESDTDDTASTVSTIIERRLSSRLSQTSQSAVSSATTNNSVAMPTTNIAPTATTINLPTKKSFKTSTPTSNIEEGQMTTTTNNNNSQLSLNKTNELIKSEQLPVEVMFHSSNRSSSLSSSVTASIPVMSSSASIPHVDTVLDSMKTLNEMKTNDQLTLTGEVMKCRVAAIEESDDDEDMSLIHRELMRQVDDEHDPLANDADDDDDDDFEDFMLDREYLSAESSPVQRFKQHHYNGNVNINHSSEPIMLGSYCELTSIREEEEEDLESEKSSLIPVSSPEILLNKTVSEDGDSGIKSPDGSMDSSCGASNRSNSSQSSFNSDKMSLGNVFDFLNEANDDFEFVERMLELTNDKIDSIDDIMRIRESIKEIQLSDQRENLERFLDSNNVVDELIALSSASNSSTHSTTESSVESDSGESNCSTGIGKVKSIKPKKKMQQLPMKQLPIVLAKPEVSIKPTVFQSKIPVLSKPQTLVKRSNSVSNLQLSQQYNSLVELRSSLIPLPIAKKPLSTSTRTGSLNRSTSMQSISTFSSLQRPSKVTTPKYIPNHRRSSLNLSGSTKHLNGCIKQDPITSGGSNSYGSLSRQVSKSSTNVFSTGSLPRPIKHNIGSGIAKSSVGMIPSHRTSSMIDLTKESGSSASPSQRTNLFSASSSSSLNELSSRVGRTVRPPPPPPPLRHPSTHLSSNNSNNGNSSASSNHHYHHLAHRESQGVDNVSENKTPPTKQSPQVKHQRNWTKSVSTTNLTASSSLSTFSCNRPTALTATTTTATTTTSSLLSCSIPSTTTTTSTSKSPFSNYPLTKPKSLSSLSSSYSAVSNFWSSFEKSSAKQSGCSGAASQASKVSRSPVARKILKSVHQQHSPELKTSKSEESLKTMISQSVTTPTTPTRSILRCPSKFKSDLDSSDSDSCSASSNDDTNESWRQRSAQRRLSQKVCFVDEVLERDFIASPDFSDDMEQSTTTRSISPTESAPYEDELNTILSTRAASISSISSLSSSGGDSCSSTSIGPLKSALKNGSRTSTACSLRREQDSGMFASSEESSEFSQSPSPDFEKQQQQQQQQQQQVQQSQMNRRSSIRERIAFFDSSTQMKTMGSTTQRTSASPVTTGHSRTGFAKNGISPMLSRSCSAPYGVVDCVESHLGNESPLLINNDALTSSTKIRVELSSNGLSKLKGLFIPYVPECDAPNTSPKLPIIKSEELYRISPYSDAPTSTTPTYCFETSPPNFPPPSCPPPLKPVNITVEKYSPMFKRREFTLPLQSSNDFSSQESQVVINSLLSTSIKFPPVVPPRPVILTPEAVSKNFDETVDEPAQKNLEEPVIQEIINIVHLESKVCEDVIYKSIEEIDEKPEIAQEIIESVDIKNSENILPKHEEIEELKEINTDIKEESKKNQSFDSSDLIIYQRQYSMRAIMLDNVTPSSVGIQLCVGSDSNRKEVTINHIELGSVADRDGRLQAGDRIVSINGKSAMTLMCEETEDLLEQAAQTGNVLLIVSRPLDSSERSSNRPTASESNQSTNIENISASPDSCLQRDVNLETKRSPYASLDHNPNNSRLITAEIMKDYNGLGFIIEGGYSPLGDRPITIKRIFRGGPLDKEGSLIEGDELQSINEQSIVGMSRADVWSHLKQLPDGRVQLTVVRRAKRYL